MAKKKPHAKDYRRTEGGAKITINIVLTRKTISNDTLTEPTSLRETEAGRAENAVCTRILHKGQQAYSDTGTRTHEHDAHRQSGADQVLALQSDKVKLSRQVASAKCDFV